MRTVLARRPCEAVRARRRRDQDRLRRAGASDCVAYATANGAGCTTSIRCSISAASSRRPSGRLARASSSPAPAGRAASVFRPIGAATPRRLGGARREPPRRALLGPLGRGLLRHRCRRLSRPADAELYVRWAQVAVFASHLRFHGTTPREPWVFGAEIEAIVRSWLELRYQLIPYLERASRRRRRPGCRSCERCLSPFPTSRNRGPSTRSTCSAPTS